MRDRRADFGCVIYLNYFFIVSQVNYVSKSSSPGLHLFVMNAAGKILINKQKVFAVSPHTLDHLGMCAAIRINKIFLMEDREMVNMFKL